MYQCQHVRGVVSTWFLSPSLEQGRSEEVNSLSRVWLFVTPWTVAYQPPPSMEFSRQAYWSGLPFPSPGDLPDPGIKPRSPTLQADTLPSEPPGKPLTAVLGQPEGKPAFSVQLFYLLWTDFYSPRSLFFSFLIYENVRVYWTCLWLERIIKGCTNYISCQINITLRSPADDLTSQSHLGCWKVYMYLSDCNSYDSWSVTSSHRSSGSIVPMFRMPWGTRFCVSYLKPRWFVLVFVCPVLCCRAQAFCGHLEQGLLSVVLGLYIAVASLAAENRFGGRRLQWLQHVGSVVVAHRLRAPQWAGSSWTRDQIRVPCIGRQILNHQVTREVPKI